MTEEIAVTPAMKRNVMTTKEACERLGISLRRLQVLLAEGKMPGSFKVGLQRLIPRKAVEARVRDVARWRASHARK